MLRRLMVGWGVLGCAALLVAFIPPVQASPSPAGAIVSAPDLHSMTGWRLDAYERGKGSLATGSHNLCGDGKGNDGSGEGKLSAMKADDDEGGDKGGDEGKFIAAKVPVKAFDDGTDEGGDTGDDEGKLIAANVPVKAFDEGTDEGGDKGGDEGKLTLAVTKAMDTGDDEGTDEGGDKGGDEPKYLSEGCHKDKPTSQAAS